MSENLQCPKLGRLVALVEGRPCFPAPLVRINFCVYVVIPGLVHRLAVDRPEVGGIRQVRPITARYISDLHRGFNSAIVRFNLRATCPSQPLELKRDKRNLWNPAS